MAGCARRTPRRAARRLIVVGLALLQRRLAAALALGVRARQVLLGQLRVGLGLVGLLGLLLLGVGQLVRDLDDILKGANEWGRAGAGAERCFTQAARPRRQVGFCFEHWEMRAPERPHEAGGLRAQAGPGTPLARRTLPLAISLWRLVAGSALERPEQTTR